MKAQRDGAALVVTPELSLCGYPPEDLLLRPAFLDAVRDRARSTRRAKCSGTTAIVGFPERDAGARYNAAAVLRDGRVAAVYRKHHLPNYTVFDEDRYFEPGTEPCVFDVDGVRCGIVICEDCWFAESGAAVARGGRARSSSCRTARRITRCSRRRASRRSRRASARRACRLST